MPDIIDLLAKEVANEVRRANKKHPPLHSPHEAWSVIFEELEELREHVRADTGNSQEAAKEALQVAAMGMKYVLNLCEPLLFMDLLCHICGGPVDTREESEGGSPEGCEVENGEWVCSRTCYNKYMENLDVGN